MAAQYGNCHVLGISNFKNFPGKRCPGRQGPRFTGLQFSATKNSVQNAQQNFKISDFQNFVAKSTRPWFKSDTYYARNRARILREAKNRRDKGQWLSQPSQEHWRRLYSAAKDRAKKKQIPFSLTREWVETRLAAGKCEVTGAAFLSTTGKPGMYSASIDRIEPSKGYTPENSRMVIWAFNRMKSDMTDEETMTLARLVTARDNC